MSNMNPDLLTATEVRAFFGGSKLIDATTLYRGIREGRYPKGINVWPRMVRWIRSECEAALAAMIAARNVRIKVREAA